jgi:hypothetical protein
MKGAFIHWIVCHYSPQRLAPMTISLGWRTVYHCTTYAAYKGIRHDLKMRRGSRGMFGAAIYFAESPEAARHKCAHSNEGKVLVFGADVDLGKALIRETPESGMNEFLLLLQVCNSVMG